MKPWHKLLLLIAALLLCLATAACFGSEGDNTAELTDTALDDALTAYLAQEQDAYYEGECFTSSHTILSTQETDTGCEVFAVTSVSWYGFLNDHFVSVSGSGAIPCKLTFTQQANGQLSLTECWQPSDGSEYEPSIREAFPAALQSKALHADQYYDQLKANKEAQAQAYLDRIGRQADIGDYSDFTFSLATDQGMSVTVSNALLNLEELFPYPYYIGTEERVEDGVRWVYETAWEHDGNGNGTATYTKYSYDDGQIAQQMSFLVTGETYEKLGT